MHKEHSTRIMYLTAKESRKRFALFVALVVLLFSTSICSGETTRIMPLGNSITWDITFNDPRPKMIPFFS